jgi:hypothetical protein
MRYPSGIDRGEARLRTFETRYGMTSAEFLQRYENDELPETLELDEWIGEIMMLQRLSTQRHSQQRSNAYPQD